jgi:hypothetical protein
LRQQSELTMSSTGFSRKVAAPHGDRMLWSSMQHRFEFTCNQRESVNVAPAAQGVPRQHRPKIFTQIGTMAYQLAAQWLLQGHPAAQPDPLPRPSLAAATPSQKKPGRCVRYRCRSKYVRLRPQSATSSCTALPSRAPIRGRLVLLCRLQQGLQLGQRLNSSRAS